MEFFKKNILPYLIPFVIGLIVFIGIISARNIFTEESTKEIYRILSDGLAIPGVVITGIGLLVFLSNEGAFDIIGYGLILFIGKFKKNVSDRKYETFYDYKLAKHANKNSFAHILLVGLFFLALGILFTILYNV